jgi:hypothetical protein
LLILDLIEVGGEMKVELLTFPLVCEYQDTNRNALGKLPGKKQSSRGLIREMVRTNFLKDALADRI